MAVFIMPGFFVLSISKEVKPQCCTGAKPQLGIVKETDGAGSGTSLHTTPSVVGPLAL